MVVFSVLAKLQLIFTKHVFLCKSRANQQNAILTAICQMIKGINNGNYRCTQDNSFSALVKKYCSLLIVFIMYS